MRLLMKVQTADLMNYTHTQKSLLFDPRHPQVCNDNYEHRVLIISSVMQITILASQWAPPRLTQCALSPHSPMCRSCPITQNQPRVITQHTTAQLQLAATSPHVWAQAIPQLSEHLKSTSQACLSPAKQGAAGYGDNRCEGYTWTSNV